MYLQRFKGDGEMGWCIGWALLFLEYLVKHPEFTGLTKMEKTKHVAQLYNRIDKKLRVHTSNAFIEKYYIRLMGL
jgi:hypothetical protein